MQPKLLSLLEIIRYFVVYFTNCNTMENFDRHQHWEKIYQTKQLCDVSWYQPTPSTSLEFVKQFKVALNAKIIDVGGGDSFLVDHLLDMGYTDITVLDISETAINRAKERLGSKAQYAGKAAIKGQASDR